MKLITDTMETHRRRSISPTRRRRSSSRPDFEMPEGGLNLRWPDDRLMQDARLQDYKGFAAHAFVRANRLDHVTLRLARTRASASWPRARPMRTCARRSRELGLTEEAAARSACGSTRSPCPGRWSRRASGNSRSGSKRSSSSRERREIVENQIKQALYNWRDDARPRIIGKMDDTTSRFLSFSAGTDVSRRSPARWPSACCAARLDPHGRVNAARAKAALPRRAMPQHAQATAPMARTPYFCSGCPHNTSTMVPEGSRALAGIGCHYMAHVDGPQRPQTFTHMGGEGVPLGRHRAVHRREACVRQSRRRHLFHSGMLAIRAVGHVQRQHHLQDPLQRRGGDDRRPACRRPSCRRSRSPSSSRPKASEPSTGVGRPGRLCRPRPAARHAHAPPRRPRRGDEGAARDAGRLGHRLSTRPAPPKSAAAASAAPGRSGAARRDQSRESAKAAATARCNRTASRSSRSRPSSAASAPSTSRPATRTIPASRASARPSSPSTADSCASARRPISARSAHLPRARRRRRRARNALQHRRRRASAAPAC